MTYLAVLAVSLFVGAVAYAATVRAGRSGQVAAGFEPAEDDGPGGGPGPGYTFLRIATRGPSWRDRILGFVGLVIVVAVGTAALTFGIYELGHAIVTTIERYFGS